MFNILTLILLGISLSMDTFSLSLCYGTLGLNKRKTILLSIIVGIFHFFMPILGMIVGNLIIDKLIFTGETLLLIILSIIGIDMIIEAFKNDEKYLIVSIPGILLFAFSVSMDSFSTGIGLKVITDNVLLALIIFTITSSVFTFIGVRLGKKLNEKFGKTTNVIGGIILILLGLYFFIF